MAWFVRLTSSDQSRSGNVSCSYSCSIIRWNLSCRCDRVTNVSVISALILKCVSGVLPLRLFSSGCSGSFPFQGFIAFIRIGVVSSDDSGEK